VSIRQKPELLSTSPKGDSVAAGEIERHYQGVEESFIKPLGIRAAVVQAWPHLESLRALFIAASFRLEGQGDLAAELKSTRLERLSDRWRDLERRLRSAQFLPCETQGVTSMNQKPGIGPGCGLKPVQYH
jgi:hypothetical protein